MNEGALGVSNGECTITVPDLNAVAAGVRGISMRTLHLRSAALFDRPFDFRSVGRVELLCV